MSAVKRERASTASAPASWAARIVAVSSCGPKQSTGMRRVAADDLRAAIQSRHGMAALLRSKSSKAGCQWTICAKSRPDWPFSRSPGRLQQAVRVVVSQLGGPFDPPHLVAQMLSPRRWQCAW